MTVAAIDGGSVWSGIGRASILVVSAFLMRVLAHRLESEWSYVVGIAAISAVWMLVPWRLPASAVEFRQVGGRAHLVLSIAAASIGVSAYLVFLSRAGVSRPNALESSTVLGSVLRLVILGPLLEEVYWRRYFLRACGQIWRSRSVVVLASTVWFSVGHAAIALPVACIVGVANSILVLRGGFLSDAVLLHAAINALLIVSGWAR